MCSSGYSLETDTPEELRIGPWVQFTLAAGHAQLHSPTSPTCQACLSNCTSRLASLEASIRKRRLHTASDPRHAPFLPFGLLRSFRGPLCGLGFPANLLWRLVSLCFPGFFRSGYRGYAEPKEKLVSEEGISPLIYLFEHLANQIGGLLLLWTVNMTYEQECLWRRNSLTVSAWGGFRRCGVWHVTWWVGM